MGMATRESPLTLRWTRLHLQLWTCEIVTVRVRPSTTPMTISEWNKAAFITCAPFLQACTCCLLFMGSDRGPSGCLGHVVDAAQGTARPCVSSILNEVFPQSQKESLPRQPVSLDARQAWIFTVMEFTAGPKARQLFHAFLDFWKLSCGFYHRCQIVIGDHPQIVAGWSACEGRTQSVDVRRMCKQGPCRIGCGGIGDLRSVVCATIF